MYGMSGLFGHSRGPSSNEVMRGQSDALRAEVDAAPAGHVLQADTEEWADALVERYAINVPTIDRARATQDEPSPIALRPYGYGQGPVQGVRYVVRVPFSGEPDVFKYRPSRRLMGEIPGKVVGESLVLELERPESGPTINLDNEVDKWLGHIEDHLEYWRNDVRNFNVRLREVALEKIASRKGDQERIRTATQASGIPIASSTGAKTYIPHAIVRKPGRVRAGRRSSGEAPRIPLDPAIGDPVYEEIVESLRAGCRRMERTPRTYRKLNEEERRDVLLTILNDGFLPEGEAFNAAGKVDILVPFEDRNLFIAECKIWGGKAEFSRAIDQLFSYRTWRDSRLALVVFVHERDLTTVVARARAALEAHDEFAGWIEQRETESRCRMTWPGDSEKIGTLTVIFVHIPK